MTMPSAYFAWTMRGEMRTHSGATLIIDSDIKRRDDGFEGGGLDTISACVLFTVAFAGVYIAAYWLIEKAFCVLGS